MRGYPEHLNTKQDYLNMLEIDKKETVRRLKELLDSRYIWIENKELEDGEEGIEDETHQVREYPIPQEGGHVAYKKFQYELKESEYATIFRLGFNVEEVEQLVRDNSDFSDDGGGQDVDNL